MNVQQSGSLKYPEKGKRGSLESLDLRFSAAEMGVEATEVMVLGGRSWAVWRIYLPWRVESGGGAMVLNVQAIESPNPTAEAEVRTWLGYGCWVADRW